MVLDIIFGVLHTYLTCIYIYSYIYTDHSHDIHTYIYIYIHRYEIHIFMLYIDTSYIATFGGGDFVRSIFSAL